MRHTGPRAGMLLLAALLACSDDPPTAPADIPQVAMSDVALEDATAFDYFAADATGHEWANSYLLALLSHYVYVPLVGATGDEDFPDAFAAHFSPLGLSNFRVIQDPLSDTEVALAETENALLIVFRGTEADVPRLDFELRDIWVDLAFVMIDHMHNGFTASSRRVLDLVRTEIENTPGKRVWLTGHSLGGALATVTAQLLRAEHGITVDGVYTYGAPRVFSDMLATGFDQTFGARSQRWVNNRDPVPHVGPNVPLLLPYQHVRVLNNIVPENGSCAVRRNDAEIQFITPAQFEEMLVAIDLADMSTWGSLFESILALGNLDDHDTARYASRIYASMPSDLRAVMPEPPYPSTPVTSCDEPQDLTPPVIAPVLSGTKGNGDWFVSDVSVSWSVTDDESDVASLDGCEETTVTSDTDGTTFTCTATSGGGTAVGTVTVLRDATPPSNVVVVADRVPDHGDWYSAPLTVTWSGTDATSGIDSCTSTNYAGPDDRAGVLSGTCTDIAGNTSEAVSFAFRYDATAPTITIASPLAGTPDYFRHQHVVAEFTCSDAASGVASCTGTTASGTALPTDRFGAHHLGVNAIDQAGNTSSTQRDYRVTYEFVGFHEPVETLPATNVARAGQRIPFKWSLVDENGMHVADRTELFDVRWSMPVPCSDTAATADLSDTSADSMSGVRWDPYAQQYIFVAATDRGDSGNCRFLSVGIGAHAQMRALVRFR